VQTRLVSSLRVPLLVIGGLVGLLVVAMALGRWVVHGPVTGSRLQRSVTVAAGALSDGDACERMKAPRMWRCAVSSNGGSDFADYFVEVEPGSSCWHARLTERGYPGDKPALRGCVHLWQWRVLD
jgi:hypothetical protein